MNYPFGYGPPPFMMYPEIGGRGITPKKMMKWFKQLEELEKMKKEKTEKKEDPKKPKIRQFTFLEVLGLWLVFGTPLSIIYSMVLLNTLTIVRDNLNHVLK